MKAVFFVLSPIIGVQAPAYPNFYDKRCLCFYYVTFLSLIIYVFSFTDKKTGANLALIMVPNYDTL